MIFVTVKFKMAIPCTFAKMLQIYRLFFDTLQQQQVGQMKKFHFVIIFLVSGKLHVTSQEIINDV